MTYWGGRNGWYGSRVCQPGPHAGMGRDSLGRRSDNRCGTYWFLGDVLYLPPSDQTSIAHSLQQPLLPALNISWPALLQLVLLAFTGVVRLIPIRFAVTRNPVDRALFWSVLTSFIAV